MQMPSRSTCARPASGMRGDAQPLLHPVSCYRHAATQISASAPVIGAHHSIRAYTALHVLADGRDSHLVISSVPSTARPSFPLAVEENAYLCGLASSGACKGRGAVYLGGYLDALGLQGCFSCLFYGRLIWCLRVVGGR